MNPDTASMSPALEKLLDWYATLQPDSLTEIRTLYTEDAYFKDPFNEFRSRERIEAVFRHMFATLADPRFMIKGHVGNGPESVVLWRMTFLLRGKPFAIDGCSHLLFTPDGRVCSHRDYWDAAEELYEKLPVLGWFMRQLRRRLQTP